MELASLLARHARFRPEATAVVFGRQRLDYRSFNARVNRVAHLLQGLGVSKGERVATLLPNTLELLETYWACARIGAVAVPLSPLLTGVGLSSLIKDAGAICLVTQHSLLPVVSAVLPELATLAPERVLLIDAHQPPWGDYAALAAAAPDSEPPADGRQRRRPDQHHVHLGHHRPAQGHHAQPSRARHVRAAAGRRLAHDAGIGGAAHRRHRLQRRLRHPDADLPSRRHLHPAPPVRRGRDDRNHRRRKSHPHHGGAGADHRPARLAGLRRRKSWHRCK